MKKLNWRKYSFEFLSIFVAVLSAFALNNWNDSRKEKKAESKILSEISNGLSKDIEDVRLNINGHKGGIAACNYWMKFLQGKEINEDSLEFHYLRITRDFVSIQNISGYETLKSRGLELIKNDSLRFNIISLYAYDYSTLRKLEEEYHEMQFQKNYFEKLNEVIAPQLEFNEAGLITGINQPIELELSEKKEMLSLIWKIRKNRGFILTFYADIEEKIIELKRQIEILK